ncbi:GNAT family N-acetyltransferase [uncultured Jatrophihabitans sp.]|uniref:GNAT family N-acetyltransferase n=1 Tax=uncultured Jatrophihabitans sp. TaxID=1610747 RepID=UPI0035CA6D41
MSERAAVESSLEQAPAYTERARTYRSVWILAAALLAGFALDLSLGGGVAHLPGWAIAVALVLGIDAFVVRAANATHSLTITVDEIRVGDEVIDRAAVAAARPGVDGALPVLGWQSGLPRGAAGVIVQLTDARELVVLTRAADQVLRILGAELADEYAVRDLEPADLAHLAEVAERADTVFRVAGYELPDLPYRPENRTETARVFVVGRPPVAFAEVDEVDGVGHLAEIAVVPGSMRRGIGGRLLEHACDWARGRGYPAITLVTYADVPWNGPWYRRRGFVEIEPSTPELSRRRQRQRDLGLDGVARRIVMQRELTG